MRAYKSALLTMTLVLSACAAQTPGLKAPILAAMQRDSVDSVNITLGPGTLGFLRFLSRPGGAHDPHRAAAANLLRDLHEVQVHSFEFGTDHIYRWAELDELTSRLIAPDWRHVVQVRDGGTNEYVDVYCALENHKITGLVIVAAEPREFTLVNVVGTLDPDKIRMLRHGFVSPHHGWSKIAFTRWDGRASRGIDGP